MATRRPARRRSSSYRRPARRRTARRQPPSPAARWLAGVLVTAVLIAAVPVLGAVLAVGLVGGGVYSVRRHRAAAALRAVQLGHIGSYLAMTPKAFEHALADLCRRDGCTRVSVVGGAGDLGADVLATTPDGRRMVLQAKRYAPTHKVGSPDVQKVGGTYAIVHRAQLAAVVTTSGYTRAAADYAARAGIRLYGQRELAAWASRTGPAPWH
ncbi:restriction endonuclease [Streptacidiphilus sp. PB12-B1b]|uniref:restriction endonuclease n=1 Tax=Streptacidiphilus sp. PB12-B1b TaxID=2705012 RepID=UPI0015FBDFC1|nr:restriction endonuclease [Streptacidiphilus sp. PB12-B1b]QMU77561.1 restriction endonuclease [Streptacidiphilus sp. PB12-B1b]